MHAKRFARRGVRHWSDLVLGIVRAGLAGQPGRFCGFLVLLFACTTAAAQPSVDVRLRVDTGIKARSEIIEVLASQDIVIDLVDIPSGADPAINIFIHEESGVLAHRDDPESSVAEFRW